MNYPTSIKHYKMQALHDAYRGHISMLVWNLLVVAGYRALK